MDLFGEGDDNLDHITPPSNRAVDMDFFAETQSSAVGRGSHPRRGSGVLEGLDLNSQALEFPSMLRYQDYLQSPPPFVNNPDAEVAGRGSAVAGRGVAMRGPSSGGVAPATAAKPSRASRTARSGSRGARGARRAPAAAAGSSGPQRVAAAAGGSATGAIGGQPEEVDAGLDEEDKGFVHGSEMSSSSSDYEDEALEVARMQMQNMQEYGAIACFFGMYYEDTFMNKSKFREPELSGYDWVMRTLNNPTSCFNMFRMSWELFYRLHDLLVSSYGLTSTKKMSSVEALAMFLWIIGAPQSIRQAENRFERSTETISRKFEKLLHSVYMLSADIIKPRDPEFRTTHPRLQGHRFAPHFDNCIGAIDGTHVPVVVPASKVLQHVGRHGYSTQNVLAICDFDMRFTFVVARWPGSVHDMRVFNDAIRKYGDKFPHPPREKFYLVDSGYPNRAGYLAPYKGTKYHLPEFRQGPRPSGKKEKRYVAVLKRARHRLPEIGALPRQKMVGGGEKVEIGGEAHHGGDTGEHKGRTADSEEEGQFRVQPRWRKFLAHVGPGALVAIGFLDPSNMETDLQAGANFKYQLLWVILVGMIFALLIQTLAANLGVKTGRHLAELCREEYPRYVNICLWIIAELAVISDDIPEVLGTAFAFNILLKIPVWAGVILTVFSTLLLLGVQRFGARKLEFIIAAFMFTMAGCFFGELSYLRPSAREVVKGMFVPSLQGKGAAANAIALFGAIITPYNLFLHSALVLSRKTPRSDKSIRAACRYFLIECSLAFIVAFLINVAVVVVAGSVCSANSLSPADANTCGDLTLQSAPLLLRNVLGRSSSVVYAVALLASGQSTTISCTFAGQVIMQGFLDMKMKNWVRNIITRVIAIAPSLIVSVVSGPSGAGKLIVLSSMILSFELPFALIPLLKFCNSSKKVGPLKESVWTVAIAWILSITLIVVNTYFLLWAYVDWLAHSHLPKYANALVSVVVFAFTAVYLVAVVYLTFRRDTVTTYVAVSERAQGRMETGAGALASAADGDQPAPYRKDLAAASM